MKEGVNKMAVGMLLSETKKTLVIWDWIWTLKSEVAGMCDGEDTTECVVRWMFELLSLNILINDMANKKWQSLYMEVLQSSGTIIHLFVWNIGLIQICILLL